MGSPFASYIEAKVKKTKLVAMPFFHNVESFKLWDILSEGALRPHDCKLFKEPLVYLFYGRPAYKVAFDKGSRSDEFFSPASIVMKPGCALDIKRIYPFDTGGFARFYKDHIPSDLDRDRFLLDTSPQVSQKLVWLFFGSNENYVLGKAQFNKKVEFRHSEVKAYMNLLASSGAMAFDDRAYTIEYQIDSEMKLSDCVMAVSAPSEAFDDSKIHELVVDQWKAFPLPYQTFHGGTPQNYYGDMFGQVRAFLKGRKYI